MSKIRAKKAISKIVENRGNVSKSLREAGYSPSYAKNPKQFLSTKDAQELMEEYLPDEMIAQRHSELANAGQIAHYTFPAMIREKVVKDKTGKKVNAKTAIGECLSDKEIKEIVEGVYGCKLIYIKYDSYSGGKVAYYQAPDNRSRKDAIDMAYKLKGKYAPEQVELTKRKYQDLSNSELIALKKKLQNHLLKKEDNDNKQ